MRIVVAAVSSNRCMSGVSRHAANVVKCLLTRSEISAVHVLVAGWEHKYIGQAISRTDARLHIHVVPLKNGALSRNFWYYHSLPAIAEQLRADIVHIAYPSPIQKEAFPCPVIATLHDLYPYDIPSNFGFPKVYLNRMILKQCLRNADAIACVSETTRIRLAKRMPEAMAKAATVSNCIEAAPIAMKPSFAARWVNQRFLLCVAQHRRNKNILVALGAFKSLLSRAAIDSETYFLLIGMSGPETRRIEKYIEASGMRRQVILVSGISDPEMNWCYRNCEVLVAPSIVEGFGMPIVEGRMAGCRIVCSDIPAFREVGSETCRFVELGEEAEQKVAEAILESLGRRRPLPAQLRSLSPAAIAEQYVKLYRSVLDLWANSRRFRTNADTLPRESTASDSKTAVPTRAQS